MNSSYLLPRYLYMGKGKTVPMPEEAVLFSLRRQHIGPGYICIQVDSVFTLVKKEHFREMVDKFIERGWI